MGLRIGLRLRLVAVLVMMGLPVGTGRVAAAGMATGGVAKGGEATEGSMSGSVAAGRMATGGPMTGAVAAGGEATEGMATEGMATEAVAAEGATLGSVATAGVATGGVATGGVATGGLRSGSEATGGVATAGSATGGGSAEGSAAEGGERPVVSAEGSAAEGGERPVTAAETLRWQAVGALEVSGHRECSAVLISDHEAITAAHCVYDRTRGHPIDPATFRLVLGQRAGGQAAIRGVRRAVYLPGYAAAGSTALAKLSQDLALLDLDAPVNEVTPLAVAPWPDPVGSLVDIVGYVRGGAAAASIREGCTAIESEAGVTAVTCAVVSGLSGAPVTLRAAPEVAPLLVATVSSRSTGAGQALAFVVTLGPHLAELRALLGP